MIEVTIPTRPARDYQRPFWSFMESGGKFASLCWHRRSGKDETAMNWTAAAAMEGTPGNYWHCFPEYEQARRSLWEGIDAKTGRPRLDQIFPPEIVARRRDKEMMLELVSGSTWQLIGSDQYNRLVGAGPKGLVMSEYSLSHPAAWAYFRPMILESGGWAVFNFTPRGRNHAHKLHEAAESDPNWFSQTLPATVTGVFSEEELAREREEYIRELGEDDGDAKFRQEYLCDFNAAIIGAYYGREMEAAKREGRIRDVPYDPGLPVFTAWDLGKHDATVIWFVQLPPGGVVHVFDYAIGASVGLDAYARLLTNRPYVYGMHYWPHDGGRGDVGIIGGQTRAEVMRGLGINPIEVLPRETDVFADGIQAVRRLLPRCIFDHAKCAPGIEALIQYSRKWDEEAKVFHNVAKHDWASHPADAFRTLAMGLPSAYKAPPPATQVDRYRHRSRNRASQAKPSRWSF